MHSFAKVISILLAVFTLSGYALVHGCESGTRANVNNDPVYEVRNCQETCLSAPESKACLIAIEQAGEICRQKIEKGYDARYERMQRQFK